jgi:hypothetical protein
MNNRIIKIVQNSLINELLTLENDLENTINKNNLKTNKQVALIRQILGDITTTESQLNKLKQYLTKEIKK